MSESHSKPRPERDSEPYPDGEYLDSMNSDVANYFNDATHSHGHKEITCDLPATIIDERDLEQLAEHVTLIGTARNKIRLKLDQARARADAKPGAVAIDFISGHKKEVAASVVVPVGILLAALANRKWRKD